MAELMSLNVFAAAALKETPKRYAVANQVDTEDRSMPEIHLYPKSQSRGRQADSGIDAHA